jgi:glycerophosphoryl diester phosphodiesterase
MSRLQKFLPLLLAAAMLAAMTSAAPARERDDDRGDRAEQLVIGHRGASGYRPEHTLAAYKFAARLGADYIEPDLAITKDGVLVARHEPEIEDTSDVEQHPEFADRRTVKTIDGTTFEGFFVEDFTLAELKTLRATERIPAQRPGNAAAYDGLYEIPTLQEVLDLRERLSKRLGREIGVYPETKHPTYFRSIGKPLEEPLIRTLRENGLDKRNAPVFVQSFEVGNLKALDRQLKVPLVQLFGAKGLQPYDFVVSGDPRKYQDLATPAGLREIARYADGVGPSKDYIVPRTAPPDGCSLAPTTFVRDAHRAGLVVHPYTFRAENSFLPCELRSSESHPNRHGDLEREVRQFFELGVDGVFVDHPDYAVDAREDDDD